MQITIKRAYDRPDGKDGSRVLVDRLWPRGLGKDKLKIDAWYKDVAPSTELRLWFAHDPEHWEEFQARYKEELASNAMQQRLHELIAAAGRRKITLVYSAHDTEHNQAVVLREVLTKLVDGTAGQVCFSIGNSGLGRVLVAATERGICAVKLGGNAAELEAELRREFRNAAVHRDDKAMKEALRTVLAQLTARPVCAALPLDVHATAFQHRVWQALQQVPRGQTRSYAQVAAAIGQPKAVRAVARACAQNPVAVLVPCHRVVGSNGKLTGYRWGLERKQKLLQMETAGTQPQRQK